MKTVVVTQPYVPAYRVPLFSEIHVRLAEIGYRLQVVSGQPRGDQAQRGDRASGPWHTEFVGGQRSVAGRNVRMARLPRALRDAHVVVTELEASNLLAWHRIVLRRPTVLWGHGKPYVTASNLLADSVELALAKRATAVMTYAPSGRQYLIERGAAPDRVFAIGNATDTREITAWRSSKSRHELDRLRRTAGDGPRAMYVGGLDAAKRIDFLLEAFTRAHERDPGFEAVVVGDGAMRSLVEMFVAENSWCQHVKQARGEALAVIGAQCDAIWMPGRVGLVAIDAIALELPILTTEFAFHAPEIEFLSAGQLTSLADDAGSFASGALGVMQRHRLGPGVVTGQGPPAHFGIEDVAEAFVAVVSAAGRG